MSGFWHYEAKDKLTIPICPRQVFHIVTKIKIRSKQEMWCVCHQIDDVVVVFQNTHHFSASQQTTKSSYWLQGHEDRSVQFATCVKVYAY